MRFPDWTAAHKRTIIAHLKSRERKLISLCEVFEVFNFES